MPTDLIRYDLLVQDALRGVVRRVLVEAAREGLPGDHHFYVTFRTTTPGVRLSNRMRERYPDEMTIVLQHQFWDLSVTEANFEVGLSFNGIAESVLVPFDALTQFGDPSVGFALKFELQEPDQESGANDTEPGPEAPAVLPAPVPAEKPKAVTGPKSDKHEKSTEKSGGKRAESAQKAAKEKEDGAPNVVSIDAFRKKT
jgi:hypothetical protein